MRDVIEEEKPEDLRLLIIKRGARAKGVAIDDCVEGRKAHTDEGKRVKSVG